MITPEEFYEELAKEDHSATCPVQAVIQPVEESERKRRPPISIPFVPSPEFAMVLLVASLPKPDGVTQVEILFRCKCGKYTDTVKL